VEPESPTRSPFQRDRDRIIHSSAFRRMQHKTQVFVYHEGDHYRTRLTHSLEVAQIARTLCRSLGLDEDLGEALALAHDLGHTPFGHAGEDALDAAMRDYGGFDHNAQTLRLLTKLEAHYADFDGLNLTWESLEGVTKHNGPLTGPGIDKPVPFAIASYVAAHDLELDTWPGAEAQIAALSDDIAYNNHDIDDGLRAGLFTIDDLRDIPLVGPVFRDVLDRYPGLEQSRVAHESIRRLIDHMVTDLLDETRDRIGRFGVETATDVRRLGQPLVAFSEAMQRNDKSLKTFLFANMYRHEKVTEMTDHARRVVAQLFEVYINAPQRMPPEWVGRWQKGDTTMERTARIVADYIAGMTDRFALAEHKKHWGSE
jgi:dGTPase